MSTIKQIFIVLAVLAFVAAPALAKPITKADAITTVQGWLSTETKPLNTPIGTQVDSADSFNDANGVCIYHVVYLKPSGYIIVAADDLVEPIVAIVTGYAYYNASTKNVLGALVNRDLPGRVGTARQLQSKLDRGVKREYLSSREVAYANRAAKAQSKWSKLRQASIATATSPAQAAPASAISDVRVAPLLASKWGQDYVYGAYCFNYYTPNHYYDGCVATAMAQYMRYWQWPATGIGKISSRIYVSGSAQTATTRGGDGLGGAYKWNLMPLVPNAFITNAQREAIGALCYDAGVAAHMQYSSQGSGAYMDDAKAALMTTFKYSSAICGGNGYNIIGTSLKDMINPNLDSGNPVLLGIWQAPAGAGHAIVADGYGYNNSSLYYHLNLGWDGQQDAWYNLPNVDTAYYTFNTVDTCIYNIYKSGNGEIISGRITDAAGNAFAGATVTATGSGGPYTATSNSNGIYALKVMPNAAYTMTVTASGSSFQSKTVTTGLSTDYQATSGNRSDVDFVTASPLPDPPAAVASISYPATSSTGKYSVSWTASTTGASYELQRCQNGSSTWMQVYLGSGLSYSESTVTGNYRYRVRALNGGGPSEWTLGAIDCVVYINTQAPVAPASLSYPATSSTGKYTVSWAASSGAVSYMLDRSSNGKTWTQVYASTGTSYSENVKTGNYKYRVRARNSVGISGLRTGSAYCVVRIPPPAPVWITYPAASSTGRYTVSWATSSGAQYYRLERSTDAGATWRIIYLARGTSFSGKLPTGNYRYRVRAVSTGGTSPVTAGFGDCLVRIPPQTPAKIAYPSTNNTGKYKITWSKASGAKSYQLQKSSDGGLTWTQIVATSGTSYNDTTVAGAYRYRVRAVSNGGISGWKTAGTQCTVKL